MTGLLSMASRSRRVVIIGIIVTACTFTATAWMSTTVSPMKYSQRSPHHHQSSCSIGWAASTTQLSYRDDDHDSLETKKKSSPASDFQSRMKRAALQSIRSSSSNSGGGIRKGTGTSWRPSNVKTAVSLEEFANIIQEGRSKNQLVVVRFYATWCKKCHSIRPSFDKVASSKPHVIFVDVPVTNTNVELHQGLGVKSVPFAHIYCPEKGLVVEEKISRSRFSEFEELVEKHSS